MKIAGLIFLSMLIVCFSCETFAQSETGANPFINDSNGRPLYMKSNYNMEGSPFLFEDYLPASLISADGKYYSNVMVKINLVDNEIYYRLPDGREMVSTTPVKDIIFSKPFASYSPVDSVVITGFNSAINKKGAVTYMICVEGKLKLLKKISISYKDLQEYGNTNTTRIFTRKESFEYIKGSSSAQRLPKGEDAIVELMSDRRKDMNRFIIAQQLELKKEADIVRLFQYYNNPDRSK
jgi:hypothetical protein